ncbi:TetR family transcriptional regulator [Kutzneria sp. CA-103260]|nr:TetR family transcriptional regulator [Kutzneria sp. CA-103260]
MDRDTVLATALRLLDEVGLDGLSMRRLADALDIKAPTLYWHFADKRALLDALSAEIAAAAMDPVEHPLPGQAWPEWLADRARAFRRGLLAHRDGARLHAGTVPRAGDTTSLQRLVEMMIADGLSQEDTLGTVLAVSRYTVGCVIEEQQATEPLPDADRHFEHGLRVLLLGAQQDSLS